MKRVVIDIPDHIYEHAVGCSEDSNDEWFVMRAIAESTPLPKGLERLIEANWLKNALHNFSKGLNREVDWEDIYCYIDAAPTIIEADKERKEE